jgi:hypothetical protein
LLGPGRSMVAVARSNKPRGLRTAINGYRGNSDQG